MKKFVVGAQNLGYTEKELLSEWKFSGGEYGIDLAYFNKKYNLLNKEKGCAFCKEGGGGYFITKDDMNFLEVCMYCVLPFKNFKIKFNCEDGKIISV